MTHSRRPALIAAAGVALLASCSSGSSVNANSTTVTETDSSLTASPSTVASGPVTVTVHNKGQLAHELVVFRTDLDENALPLEPDGHKIDEEGSGITHLDPEAEDIDPGGSQTITVDLPAGRYVFVCNVADHYKQGMHAVVTST